MSKILVVAAHPDDETLGCGGTIARHVSQGDEVGIITLTNGVSARTGVAKKDLINREEAAKKAIDLLGAKWIGRGNFCDNGMDKTPLLEIIKYIESFKETFYPDIIYSHTAQDLNVDHRVVTTAVLTAFRPQPEETYKEIRLFEVPSSTDFTTESLHGIFTPNLFIDIQDFINIKIEALNFYDEEMREYPHTRSYMNIETVAKYRGASVGIPYAEAFQIVRRIHR